MRQNMMRKRVVRACFLMSILFLTNFFFTCASGREMEMRGRKGAKTDEHDEAIPGKAKGHDAGTGNEKGPVPVMIHYTPPLRGRPGNRVGGGTRGHGDEQILLAALVPDHTGLTTEEQPELYWYISQITPLRIEFTLINERIEPLLEISLREPERKGIQCVRLADYGIRLLPDVEYQWYVALIPDPNARSKDLVAGGTIRRIEPPQGLSDALKKAEKMTIPIIHARNGLWYDALHSLCELISTDPNNREMRELRNELLEQAGLPEIVELERDGIHPWGRDIPCF